MAFWATSWLGAIPCLMNGWWTAEEFADAVALVEPALVVGDAARLERVKPVLQGLRTLGMDDFGDLLRGPTSAASPAPATREDDSAFLIFTSGTTGRAKAVSVPHRAACGFAQVSGFSEAYGRGLFGVPASDGGRPGTAERRRRARDLAALPRLDALRRRRDGSRQGFSHGAAARALRARARAPGDRARARHALDGARERGAPGRRVSGASRLRHLESSPGRDRWRTGQPDRPGESPHRVPEYRAAPRHGLHEHRGRRRHRLDRRTGIRTAPDVDGPRLAHGRGRAARRSGPAASRRGKRARSTSGVRT